MTFEKEKSVFKKNTLFYGDNLDIMRRFPDECVDLIYLDPPFNSNETFNIPFDKTGKAEAQSTAFDDTWKWNNDGKSTISSDAYDELIYKTNKKISDTFQGLHTILGEKSMLAYLVYMGIRLVEMRRILKKTGSIYLHCDQNANAYLRLVMDAIFNKDNFQNEVIWRYGLGGSSPKRWSSKHDDILFYSKTNDWYFKPFMIPATSQRMKGELKKQDDVWDIPTINNMAKERIGYPTQKPEALLERIIKASSNKDDVVLDPFCGCGTTVAVAERLERKWIGIDIAYVAIEKNEERLKKVEAKGKKIASYNTDGIPKDMAGAEALANKDRHLFAQWAVGQIGGNPSDRKSRDEGIDGWMKYPIDTKGNYGEIEIQVKSGHIGEKDIREFESVLDKHNSKMGIFITLKKPTSGMEKWNTEIYTYKVGIGEQKIPKIQILTIEEIFAGKKLSLPPIVPIMKEPQAIVKVKHQKKLEECSADKADPSSAS